MTKTDWAALWHETRTGRSNRGCGSLKTCLQVWNASQDTHVSTIMAKVAPGDQGGAKTQRAEINRTKGTYKCQFCTRQCSHFSQIHRTDGFLNFLRSSIPLTIRQISLSWEKHSDNFRVSQIPNAWHDHFAGHLLSGSIIHRMLECRGKGDSLYS